MDRSPLNDHDGALAVWYKDWRFGIMVASMKVEYYPLWMKAHPELFEKSKAKFMEDAKAEKLSTIKEYWQFGLFYIEAS
jgi:hypothetical protein